MENEKLIYGLAERHYLDMVRVFRNHPSIQQVLIFGSRAKGAEKPYSDFDLAVIAPDMNTTEFSRLVDELDTLELVFKLDVLHFDTLSQHKLQESILSHGRPFYPLAS